MRNKIKILQTTLFLLFFIFCNSFSKNSNNFLKSTWANEQKQYEIVAENRLSNAYDSEDLIIESDRIFYQNNAIIAVGNVHLSYKHYKVKAGTIILRREEKQIVALNKVEIFDLKEKNQYNTELADINYENWQGLALHSRLSIYNNKILVHTDALRKLNDSIIVTGNMSATPCSFCERDNLPLWQVKAKEVVVNLTKEKVEYRNVSLQILDHTILKLPYFFSQTINASAKSGFKFPNIQASSNVGLLVKTPYYFRVSNNFEVILTTGISSSRPIVSDIQIQHLLDKGGYKFRINATNNNIFDFALDDKVAKKFASDNKKREFRSYYKGKGNIAINNNSEMGFNIDWLTDKTKTYLKKYKIDDDDILHSHIYFNAAKKNWYASSELIKSEDLRDIDSPGNILTIRNTAYCNKFINNHTSVLAYFDISNLSARSDSLSYANISSAIRHQNISKSGIVTTLYLGLRGSGIKYDESNFDQKVFFLTPKISINLNLPMKMNQWLIQPIFSGTLVKTSNDESNLIKRLYEPNLYRLSDKVTRSFFFESNVSQALYGVKMQKNILYNNLFTFLIGREDQSHAIYSNQSKSNYVMFHSLNHDNSYIDHKIWFNSHKGQIVHDEINLTKSWKKTEISIDYTFMNLNFYHEDFVKIHENYSIHNNHELGVSFWYNFYQKWWANINGRSKFGKGKIKDKMISQGAGVSYKHECLQVDLGCKYDYLKLKDLQPSMTYYCKVGLPGII